MKQKRNTLNIKPIHVAAIAGTSFVLGNVAHWLYDEYFSRRNTKIIKQPISIDIDKVHDRVATFIKAFLRENPWLITNLDLSTNYI